MARAPSRVVLREAKRVIASREPRLLFLGTTDVPQAGLPEGMLYVPMSCQSEGALQVYVEPVVPALDLVVVGRSPMTRTLAELAGTLGWKSRVIDAGRLLRRRRHRALARGDRHAGPRRRGGRRLAVSAAPAFVGLVASRKRGEALLDYLAERGVPQDLLDRVRTPVGLDLGRTTHREIAVAVLAELVQRRAAGEFSATASVRRAAKAAVDSEVLDPVCGMTVTADDGALPGRARRHDVPLLLRRLPESFAADPARYLSDAEA